MTSRSLQTALPFFQRLDMVKYGFGFVRCGIQMDKRTATTQHVLDDERMP
jgi:hypothetical protein